MKTINYINSFLLGIPLIIFILAFLKIIDLTVYGLLSVIFIGLFQIIVSGYMLFKEPQNKYLQLYIIGVVFYFVMICIDPFSSPNFKTYFGIGIPIILAFYLSILIYKKAEK
ncbi:hypothetical protein ACHRVK_13165 [Flavobacterium plurextorum]|uniref:hypothetical protein n=1 Tax=Flavobacterium plurextorum TaxID=1114867 RepID=UPI003757D8EC